MVEINLTPYLGIPRPVSDSPFGPCGLTQFPYAGVNHRALAADIKSTLHETTTFGPHERDVQAVANPDH